jgi:hypothetical protein
MGTTAPDAGTSSEAAAGAMPARPEHAGKEDDVRKSTLASQAILW